MKTNVICQGDIGTGKTRALITLLPTYVAENGDILEGAGVQPFLVALEPGAVATLGRNLCGHPRPHDHVIHYHFIPPVGVPWETFASYVQLANQLPLKTLLETTDPNKRQYRQFIEVFDTCKSFTCDGCGENFGDATEWGEDRALALDSVTGLTRAATQNLVGGKPIRTLPEIGTIMEFIEGFVDLFFATKCSAILLAHTDREISPVTGQSTITIHTIGQKLAPRLVKKPDEVVTAHFNEGRFYWSTEPEGGTEVQKRRRLPYSDNIPPDYSLIFKAGE